MPVERRTQPSQAPEASKLAPGLYVVATPIGNLEDITPRARRILTNVDIIACEDSRVTGKLMHHLGHKSNLIPYHDHNAQRIRPHLLAELASGKRVALVSDAGTPAIADPGYRLVRESYDAGHPVYTVPGPSAVISALSIAGLPTDRFFFQGFLPVQASKRRRTMTELANIPGTLVFYEAPNRVTRLLEECLDIFGIREAAIVREMTKLHEEFIRAPLSELVESVAGHQAFKGEVVILIAPPENVTPDDALVDEWLIIALQKMGPSAAAASVAERSGRPRSELYRRAIELQRK